MPHTKLGFLALAGVGFVATANFDTYGVTRWPAGYRTMAVAIPPGYAGFVLPRSGLALRRGLTVVNAPGLIDPQYRGEIKVLLLNTDPAEAVTVHRGDRIAQLVVQAIAYVEWLEVDDLDVTTRDTFGFGSTGR